MCILFFEVYTFTIIVNKYGVYADHQQILCTRPITQ
jgi:hypothetical protein